ncbi:MAG: isochorismatase family cysteine hydrolase [Cyanobacteria bacterium P01_A01_bin.17]
MIESTKIPTDWVRVTSHPHPFPLCLSQTALLVIDMQKDFCHPDGFSGSVLGADLTAAQVIIPKIQAVLDWARQRTIPIIYTRESHHPDGSDLSPSKRLRYQNAGYPVGSAGKLGRFLVQGETGTEILDELQPAPQDWVLDKPAQSAFVGTELEEGLRSRTITHLLITGVTTQCCVLGTYRQASDLGFYALLLEDCCAAFNEAEHQAAVDVLLSEQGAVGWVSTSAELQKVN